MTTDADVAANEDAFAGDPEAHDHDHGHDGHGHDDDHGHGHDDHGSDGDAWVVPPILVGFVIAIIIVVIVGGTASGALPF